jgi:preprotein translocase subunit YajC
MMKKMLLTAVLALAATCYCAGLVIAQEAGPAQSTTATQGSQPTTGGAGATQPPPPPKSPFDNAILYVMIGGVVLLYIFMSRGRKKQEQKQKQMLASLKKGDKITTIGGIVGTAVEVRDDEVIVKVDESSNTRMKFARWAIRGIGEASKTDNPADKK